MENNLYRFVKASDRKPESWKKVQLIVNGRPDIGHYDPRKDDFITSAGWAAEPFQLIEWVTIYVLDQS